MHRLIIGAQPGQQVDHVNGNSLDNRRSNLRLCTPRENIRNMHRSRNQQRGGLKGLKRNSSGRWSACIRAGAIDGNGFCRTLSVGTFTTKEQAARAYDSAARHFFGEFAALNFLDGRDEGFRVGGARPERMAPESGPKPLRVTVRKSRPAPSKSGFLGVALQADGARGKPWRAFFPSQTCRAAYVGAFDTAFEAARARDAMMIHVYGGGQLNFPIGTYSSEFVESVAVKLGKSKNQVAIGYRGVCRANGRGKWLASITTKGKTLHLGSFASPRDAALAYDDAARAIRGPKARLNFP